jgi:hypothetical protein
MGRGGTNSLLSSGITCKVDCVTAAASEHKQLNLEEVFLLLNFAGVMLNQSMAYT